MNRTINNKRSEVVTTVSVLKFVLEAVVFIALIAAISYLIRSQNGIVAVANSGQAREKLDAIMKELNTDGQSRDIEEILDGVEGVEKVVPDEEKKVYQITIDGTDFVIYRDDGVYYEAGYFNPVVEGVSQEGKAEEQGENKGEENKEE